MGSDDVTDLMRQQAEVRDDVERLREQAGPLSAVWTGISMDGPDIVVLLTEPEQYEQHLRAVVEHPDRLHVRWSRYTRIQLDEVHRQAIDIIGDGTWQSHWPGLERVGIALHANQVALAQQLHEQFSDAIEVTLGRHRFPLDPTAVIPAPPTPESTIELPDVAFEVHPDRQTQPTGEDIHGHVTIRNHSTTHLELKTDRPALGVLLNAEHQVVGGWNGAIVLPGRLVSIAPGDEFDREFIAGSDTFDPRLGASLPAGTYLLTIAIDIDEHRAATTPAPEPHHDTLRHRRRGPSQTYVTSPMPVLLT